MSRKIPDDVQEVAEHIDDGQHPSRFDPIEGTLRRRTALKERDNWEQISGSGEPFYVHTPSGFAVVLDARNKAGVIGPDEMEHLPTTMLAYYRAMNDQELPLGLIDPDPFKEIAKTCNDYRGKLDKDAVLDRIAPCDCDESDEPEEPAAAVAEAITEAGQCVVEKTAEHAENDEFPEITKADFDYENDTIRVVVTWPLTDDYEFVYDIHTGDAVTLSTARLPCDVLPAGEFTKASVAREAADNHLRQKTTYTVVQDDE